MIGNDQELASAQDRITHFLRILAQLRIKADPEEFPLVASGYRTEVEKMQREVLDYLTQHVSQTTARAG